MVCLPGWREAVDPNGMVVKTALGCPGGVDQGAANSRESGSARVSSRCFLLMLPVTVQPACGSSGLATELQRGGNW